MRSTELVYLPDQTQVSRLLARRMSIVLVALGSVATLIVTVGISGLPLGLPGTTGLLFLLVVIVAGVGLLELAIGAMTERPASIAEGVLSLPFPIKRTDGSKRRTVALDEIVDLDPSVTPNGFNGVSLLLLGGTRVFLAQGEFKERGTAIMEELSSRFGKPYSATLNKILLEGRVARFAVREVSRSDGVQVVLSKPLPSASGRRLKNIPRKEITRAERAQTPYAGWVYLLTLSDGTRFLLREENAVKAEIETT